jgi:hypothetical protein
MIPREAAGTKDLSINMTVHRDNVLSTDAKQRFDSVDLQVKKMVLTHFCSILRAL